jgi:hypothetical protein
MSLDSAIDIILNNYNIEKSKLVDFLENNKKEVNEENIILPYYGKIFEHRCKGIIFNHGLYTQCNEKIKIGFCKKCEKQKYGSIYDRQKYEIGNYITKSGKKEVNYGKFIKKMNYNIDEVKRCFIKYNIDFMDYFTEEKSKSRGRPRKETIQSVSKNLEHEDTIEVVEVEINSSLYYRSREGVLLDRNSYEIVGILVNNKIEKIE